mgnify:CR=1 FL=1
MAARLVAQNAVPTWQSEWSSLGHVQANDSWAALHSPSAGSPENHQTNWWGAIAIVSPSRESTWSDLLDIELKFLAEVGLLHLLTFGVLVFQLAILVTTIGFAYISRWWMNVITCLRRVSSRWPVVRRPGSSRDSPPR